MRPVDLQNNFSKAPLVAREQHVQQTRPDIAQYQASEQQGKDQVRNQRRVKANENTESILMNPEKQNNSKNKKNKSKQNQSNRENKKNNNSDIKSEEGKGQLLDLTI
jgi:sRNA-binding protein